MVIDKTAVTRGRKYGQVIDGARRVFMRDGYTGASVDEISREAGVSKATLYSYFPDKRIMFTEMFGAEIDCHSPDTIASVKMDLPMTDILKFLGHMIADHFTSEPGARIFRVAVAEAARFPHLSAQYYRIGQVALQAALEDKLTIWQGSGELRTDIADLGLAADCFVQLNAVCVRDRVALLGRDSVDDAMIRTTVSHAVEVFTRAFGTPKAIAQLTL